MQNSILDVVVDSFYHVSFCLIELFVRAKTAGKMTISWIDNFGARYGVGLPRHHREYFKNFRWTVKGAVVVNIEGFRHQLNPGEELPSGSHIFKAKEREYVTGLFRLCSITCHRCAIGQSGCEEDFRQYADSESHSHPDGVGRWQREDDPKN